MNWGFYLTGFGLGAVKFLFSQVTMFGVAVGLDDMTPTFFNLFVPTYVGAIFGMAVFYFSSELLMERSAKKHADSIKLAVEKGETVPLKKKFTKMNKLMVWLKMKIGIYGITFLAPLLLSIPIGSVICAKFYGHKKKTYPLMVMFTGLYAFAVTSILLLING
jgi:cytochrome b subunit of formate dehydrogenase